MQITTTKKLRGLLELSSIGRQLKYDHRNDKGQSITLDNKYANNQELKIAENSGYITISGMPEMMEGDYGPIPEPTVRLINIIRNPITIKIDNETKEIAPGGSIVVVASVLKNPYVSCLIGKKLKVDDLEESFSEDSGLDIDADPVEPETIAVVANPNDEVTYTTPQEIKKINANKLPIPKKEEKSLPHVYSPAVDEEPEEKPEINFVDQEQEAKRIEKNLGKKAKILDELSESKTIDTEVVKLDKMEDTTPVVVQRKKSEEVPMVSEKPKRGRKKIQRSTEIFDI